MFEDYVTKNGGRLVWIGDSGVEKGADELANLVDVNTQKKLADNPKHPSLQTHEYHSVFGPSGEKIFEAYAENNTPGAYRILFYYGRVSGEIDILMITPHPWEKEIMKFDKEAQELLRSIDRKEASCLRETDNKPR